MEWRGTAVVNVPTVPSRDLRLLQLHRVLTRMGYRLRHQLTRGPGDCLVTGLDPRAPRANSNLEDQRLAAIHLVRSRRLHIRDTAFRLGVPPDAVAGAILWEGLENPYIRRLGRRGPGGVAASHWFRRSEAEEAERAGLVSPPPARVRDRRRRLRDPDWAVRYIAAIMRRHADVYRRVAGYGIGDEAGVYGCLYQGGRSEIRATWFAQRRAADPDARPLVFDQMGPWIAKNRDFIAELLL